jgi:serpin B
LSLRLALAMTYNGASGQTKQAMADVLGLTGLTDQQVNDRFSALMKSLEGLGDKARIQIANSLWANQAYQFSPEFIQACQASYDAEAANLDFGDPITLQTINNWVKDRTEGRIDKIVDRLDPMNDILVLINALTFDGKWTESFDPALTQVSDFHLAGGTTTQAQMMSQEGSYNYYQNDRLQAVALPYGDGKVSMYIFLPKQGTDFQAFLGTLTASDWDAANFQSTQGSVAIPRFTLQYDRTLNDDLVAMGMGIAFAPDAADFSAMGPQGKDFYISEVRQKDYIEVNEEGTKAAAATSAKIGITSAPANSFTLNADRPFFFAIVDNASGTPLFLGSVTNPGQT